MPKKLKFDDNAGFWHGSFEFQGDDDEREATQREVDRAFRGVLAYKREDSGAWLVQAPWLDVACGGCEDGAFELQRDAVLLKIEWQ